MILGQNCLMFNCTMLEELKVTKERNQDTITVDMIQEEKISSVSWVDAECMKCVVYNVHNNVLKMKTTQCICKRQLDPHFIPRACRSHLWNVHFKIQFLSWQLRNSS